MGFRRVEEVAVQESHLNAYPRLDRLAEPRGVVTLDPARITPDQVQRAVETILDGRFMAEHAAAGEATRLKMGTKYLINPRERLSLGLMAEALARETGRGVTEAEILDLSNGVKPDDLLDLSLGARHMLQMAFDLIRLARAQGRDPAGVLEKQWTIVILNQASAREVLEDLAASNFFGFNQAKVLLMVQEAFPGIGLQGGRFFFDPASPKRLHNHGQMAMQQTWEGQVFTLEGGSPERRRVLKPEEYSEILGRMEDKLSYNIEDLSYLTGALDLEALALALELSDGGARMVMEIVANDPDNPVKGGLAAWDEGLGRNVMIESFQLLDLPKEELKFLNRNFNHYPRPLAAFESLASGLPMPITVKQGYLYFQPVQGDLNFSLETAFVRRTEIKPLNSWKSAVNSPATVSAMAAQDRQAGFKEFAEETLQRHL